MGWRGILGFEYGIIQAPLGPDISGPELVASVANSGALGLLRAPDWESPEYMRDLIRKTRTLTDKPFGVGVVLAFPHKQNIKAILEEKVAVLQVYWGECTDELVHQAHQAGVKVVPQGLTVVVVVVLLKCMVVVEMSTPTTTVHHSLMLLNLKLKAHLNPVVFMSWFKILMLQPLLKVGSVDEAKRAADAGVDAIIVQGREAGGHVRGQDGLFTLLPLVVDLVRDQNIEVIAAGGIVDERGYVAALAFGAHGVCLGTRFLATNESYAHPLYKRKILEYSETEYTNIFGRARWPGAHHRVLKTPSFISWRNILSDENETNQPVIGHSIIHDSKGKDIRRLAGTIPNLTTTGDIDSMAMYAGEGVGLITEILPAGVVVSRLVKGAQRLINEKFIVENFNHNR